jgi:hypothetical protein
MRPQVLAHCLLAALLCAPAFAETIDVKYYGSLELKPFDCQDYTRSSFVNRVCYDKTKQFMVIKLRETYYPYCAIDASTVSDLRSAESMGRFYNANIKGRFDFRVSPAPKSHINSPPMLLGLAETAGVAKELVAAACRVQSGVENGPAACALIRLVKGQLLNRGSRI